ncbi:DNA internalization-related competence protein ComEC/Rec2 [Citrobacter sp. JGM124]|uniref:DNA internalization-related competence protein ComEC/Rec2 n=1 Tax=Citrobacter sp. JGM124 TaxID=2799789 RepID=UPI001BA6FE6B|nr:DNA internalization-related competence protein ComEC/Rec2 [Citrobacter sp. JGM124]MBS0847802.1 DNA internalization-related competence protein ComEC/Rec2 [Citrobacter sp. JGM124]
MLRSACLIFIAGLLPLLWLPGIPSLPWLVGLLLLALVLLSRQWQGYQKGGLLLLSFCWGCLFATQILSFFQHIPQTPVSADVIVVRSDGEQYHEVKIVRLSGRLLFPQPGVRIHSTKLPSPVCAGQRLRLKIKLRPLHGQLNEGGFDSQRFYLAQNLLFSGHVLSARVLSDGCSLQSSWMSAVLNRTADLPMQGIIIALAFGERLGLSAEQKQLLNQTGTAHLMAISGMHISLAAGLGWLAGRACQLMIPSHRIGYRFPLLCSLVLALGYTWLSGCNPPALRAMFALTIWSVLRLSGRKWVSWDVWLLCIAGILLHNPLVLLSDSFCLSALAVASLLFWYQWMPLNSQFRRYPWFLRYPVQLLHLQLGIMLLLLPLQINIFHGISLSALVANFFAIPLISFIVVPLLLVALLINDIGQSGAWLWWVVDRVLIFLFYLLACLPEGWLNVEKRGMWASIIGWTGVIWWRTGAWQHYKAALLVAVTGVALSHQRGVTPPQVWQMTMLDIGHGLAVAIIRDHRVLLYDTGGIWAGGDAGQQTIIPWLKWHNLTLDAIVLSHEHLDHVGGLKSLQRWLPGVSVRSSLGWDNHLPCYRGTRWEWQGLEFDVLWPPPEERLRGNNNSCVIRVSDGYHRLLLTGDLEASAEFALLRKENMSLQADYIQVPHHGSRTSSTETFLKAVAGRAAFASTSRYNQWHLPSSAVVTRYKERGYQWYDTPHSGQLTLAIDHKKWEINGFREQIVPRWYHQWFGVITDNE